MDTRQLAAFCAVVEKKSFSQAAERLGVTQPAVSLQIRALEKRLGAHLLDRSGRRVEPTEAGQRLYRNAQRVLAAEEQLLDELTEGERIAGRFELGASTGPGGSVVPLLLGELARPPGHRFAGKTISLDQLREETLILMQEGAGVREAIEDELRAAGMRSRDFDARLELGLQESVRAAVEAGFGVTFISRSAIEAALAAGTLTEAHVKGLEPSREIFLARAAGRTLTRAAQAFLDLARERLG